MLGKILLTIIAVALIWFGFKYVTRMAELKARRAKQDSSAGQPKFAPVEDGESVQDLIKCPSCSTYRSSKLSSCGRSDCPY